MTSVNLLLCCRGGSRGRWLDAQLLAICAAVVDNRGEFHGGFGHGGE